MSKILITGHRGFIGSRLGKEMPGFVGIDIVEGNDIRSCELPPADVVYHLAANSSVVDSVKDPVWDAEVNIIGTMRLARAYPHARLIYTSSGGAIQEVITSPYGASKLCSEEYIKLYAKDAVILRFPNIYGDRDTGKSVVDIFKRSEKLRVEGDGSHTRQYVHVDDIVRALIMARDWAPGLYTLGGHPGVSSLELAKATGKPYEHVPAREGDAASTVLENTTPNWQPTINVFDYLCS